TGPPPPPTPRTPPAAHSAPAPSQTPPAASATIPWSEPRKWSSANRRLKDEGRRQKDDHIPSSLHPSSFRLHPSLRRFDPGPLPDRCLDAVYRELMSGSFALEKPLSIGFLGPDGSFSHSASMLKFGSSVQYVPLSDIPGVFEEVVRGHIDYGLVPVENSLHGGVIDTLDAFLSSSAKICAEVLISVHHNLLSTGPWEQV